LSTEKKFGRPRIGKTETQFIGFKADATTNTQLDKAASSLGIRKSDVIRAAVDGWLKAFQKHAPGKSA
jgi:hypothetical protein